MLVDLIRGRQATVASAREAARQQAVSAAGEVDAELRELQAIARRLAEELAAGPLSQGEIGSRLTRMMEDTPEIHALGVAYEPFQTFYRVRRGEAVETVETGRLEDDADIAWYASAIENGPGWNEPVWDQTEQGMMATYSAPFFRIESDGDRAPAGVAYLTISMDRIEKRIDRLQLGKTGYGVVLSKQGYFLVHPSEAMVRQHVSTFQIADRLNDEVMREAVERATRGESGSVDHINLLTGQSSWFFYEPVRESGWSAFVLRITDEVLTIGRFFRRRMIWVSIYSILGLMGVAIWVSSHWYRAQPGAVLWGLVAFFSLLLLAGSGVIRYVVYHQVLDED